MLKMKNLLVEAPEDVTADIEKAQTGGLATAVSIFSKIASDPDFQKIANAGKTDGDEGDEVILSTDKGKVIRCAVKEIRVAGRNTQGVRIKKLKTDEKVVSAIKIDDNLI